jgi:hypothetical protein
VYRVIAERPAEDYRYFLNPTVVIDIDTHLRVVFAAAVSEQPPPELKRDGRCDEPAFVHVIGKVLLR